MPKHRVISPELYYQHGSYRLGDAVEVSAEDVDHLVREGKITREVDAGEEVSPARKKR